MKYSVRSLMKFSIRDLLLVTVIVAVVVGWWLDRSRLCEKARNLELRLDLEKSLADMEVATAEARRRFEKSLAEAIEVGAQAQADASRVQAAAKEALEYRQSDEGPLRGYKLLGPPPPLSKP